jgi:hypothetical protein
VFPDLRTTISNILADAFDAADTAASNLFNKEQAQSSPPEVVLVVLGSQMRTSDVRQHKRTGSLVELQQVLDEAASAVVMPHVLHELQDLDITEAPNLSEQLSQASKSAQVRECHGISELPSLLQADTSGPSVLLLRTEADAEQPPGSRGALQAELSQVRAVHEAVKASGKKHLTLYGVQPEATLDAAYRRRLQGVSADVGTCGQLCMTQVKWLEGIMALAIITVAAASGLMCIYMLDTPTKFQLPKERERNA